MTKMKKIKLTANEVFLLGNRASTWISHHHGSVLRPSREDIVGASKFLNLTQADARRALEYYVWGHTCPEHPAIKR